MLSLNLIQVKYYQVGPSRLFCDSDKIEMLIWGTRAMNAYLVVFCCGETIEGFKITLTDKSLKCSTWRSTKSPDKERFQRVAGLS